MSHINLLPWRESLRQQQKQSYLVLLLFLAIATFAAMYGAAMFVEHLITSQQQRNEFLQQQIQVLDIKIAKIKSIREQKAAIEQKMALIEQLQTSRNITPRVLDELVRLLPPGISFRSLSRKQNHIEVLGASESNNRLADFMRRLEQSEVFIDGELSSIVADTSATDAVSEFKLTFIISPTVAPEFSTEKQSEAQP